MLPELIKASHAAFAEQPQFGENFEINPQPVIGIVSQPLSDDIAADPRLKGKTSYIMQAYV